MIIFVEDKLIVHTVLSFLGIALHSCSLFAVHDLRAFYSIYS